MSDSEIAELCRRIYQKHQRALDLIYEHRPDRQTTIQKVLENLIEERTDLVLDASGKTRVRFGVKHWDIPMLLEGSGWTPSGRLLLFEFLNDVKRLKLSLYIGPGTHMVVPFV